MPPRKKAKASAASTPLRDTQPKTPQDSGRLSQSQEDVLADPWADEQETQLFKSMMKWKPTGLHKHFRMISIHNDMRSHGFAADDAPHTRIPGIWRKLHQLYDLETLDARENDFAYSEDPDPTDPEEATNLPDFELPEDEFGELMWNARFHREESAAASTPGTMSIEEDKALYVPNMGLLKDLPDGVRSHKAESIAEVTPTPKTAKGTRASRAAAKSGKGAKAAASAAKNVKARSTVSESTEEEEDDDDEEEESSTESEEDSAPVTRRANRNRARQTAPKQRTRKR
ncbi:CT20-domain-containing protein [Dothidotthia symphoricarpi CBS 119687]|uniref:CT20-domain-containing protein n=1 Tax=Dothidotthia symphoricarpi CBS 119687 TaxID=1392245 RepID=A0A6A6AA94_9PLEO|nr:CT20-domain-containing protein [Dothidotthia symphoricarpi CBS 119687]KAF2127601.1 CT20-domain-containing protein [Dothidotthia symphoricarpi CBS 119687]